MEMTRFIVRTRQEGSTLNDFLALVAREPGHMVVDIIGPAGRPHTAVIAVDEEHAPSFAQRFSNPLQLMIERDRPLSLFDNESLLRSERKSNA